MKTIKVYQKHNPDFLGPHTPDIDPYVYVVDKVTNSTAVNIRQTLTEAELNIYCESDLWDVTVV